MTERTKAALRELALSITETPSDARELKPYGDMPLHLIDVMEDLAAEALIEELEAFYAGNN